MRAMGTWFIRSQRDPRWNREGIEELDCIQADKKLRKMAEEMKKTLGEYPEDLEIGFQKG